VPAQPLDPAQLRDRLAALDASDIVPLSGGASSLTYSALVDGRRVVVKVAPPGLPPVLNRDVLRQARLLRALQRSAVPVPEVIWENAGDPPDVPPLFVMSFVDGDSLEPLFDLDGDVPEAVVAARMRNAAATLGALHAIDPRAIGLADEPTVGVGAEIDRWCRALDTVDLALAPDWQRVADELRSTQPHSSTPAVVHGDFRLGNLLANGPDIAAVVDWEIWGVGDPRVDVGWFLVNADPQTYRRETRYASALPTLAELFDEYVRAFGRESPDRPWFESLACFKSTATWSLIVKHNRRRGEPDADVERVAAVLPHLLERARRLLRA
jgi:aminoglycoside phosphotransferase (APT) family kinase protein